MLSRSDLDRAGASRGRAELRPAIGRTGRRFDRTPETKAGVEARVAIDASSSSRVGREKTERAPFALHAGACDRGARAMKRCEVCLAARCACATNRADVRHADALETEEHELDERVTSDDGLGVRGVPGAPRRARAGHWTAIDVARGTELRQSRECFSATPIPANAEPDDSPCRPSANAKSEVDKVKASLLPSVAVPSRWKTCGGLFLRLRLDAACFELEKGYKEAPAKYGAWFLLPPIVSSRFPFDGKPSVPRRRRRVRTVVSGSARGESRASDPAFRIARDLRRGRICRRS